MKEIFVMMMAALTVFGGCKNDEATPPYAASTQTWEIANLTWSDAIHDPACDKPDFDGGTDKTPKADGRSYTHEGKTCFYYSWPYVNEHAARLCPSPWRVPTYEDVSRLCSTQTELIGLWGLGGYFNESKLEWFAEGGYYWLADDPMETIALALAYWELGTICVYYREHKGLQLRCVK
jgi:hypothetical protein